MDNAQQNVRLSLRSDMQAHVDTSSSHFENAVDLIHHMRARS